MITIMWELEQIDRFEEIIDVRSPLEYEIDHIPKADNFPVLTDKERAEVGTLYRHASAFEAKRLASHMVTANISNYLREHFNSRGKNWKPLVYCWRGGNRSKSFVYILNQIGWKALQLPGGYKSYRKAVVQEIDHQSPHLSFKVLCGRTGVGKSLLLQTLKQQGAQTLDLEALSNHRGSVLGNPITGKQPTQKRFESLLCMHLRQYDPEQVIFVEAESKKIGKLQIPESLLHTIRNSPCINVETDIVTRTHYLINEYRHFLENQALLESALSLLIPFCGKKKIERWLDWENQIGPERLVQELLEEHYDPIYLRSMKNNFAHYHRAQQLDLSKIDNECLGAAAENLLKQ